MQDLWGPLAALAGTWEGDRGLDIAYGNVEARVIETPFRERMTFNPFGPVANGAQKLYGLDYRTAAWRTDEVNPFHTEVGYWLWDAADQQLMRCFVVPRGSTILAGGTAAAGDRRFTMTAAIGSPTYGILSSPYLDRAARCTRYECIVSVDEAVLQYDETTTLELAKLGETFAHVDRNVLRRVSE